MRIDEAVKREVRARVDIATLIGSYVPLKKRGRDLVGLCPFHAERTPSFHVHPEDGFFKCFGCGAAGDVFTFMQRLENVPFPEALRMLAARAGVEVEEESPQAARHRNERELIYEANTVATAYFARMLASPQGSHAREYAQQRGLGPAAITKFSLGYAPDSWDGLVTELRAHNVDLAVAAKAGLVKPRQSGGYYDFYRDRLMIPTFSTTGEVIAFGGRALGDAEQKYLNTTTTPVYVKGRHLYALNIARRAAALDETLIVVEGYLDCIALHVAGFENAVAALGTAFTEEQARELRKYAQHIYLCFDSDEAGNNAAFKAIDMAVKVMEHAGSSVRIVQLPSGSDPDSFVRAQGPQAFRQALADAKPSIEFKLDREIDALRSGFESPSTIAAKGEKLIREMTPVPEWDKWRVYVAGRLKISADALRNSRFLANSANFAPRAHTAAPTRHQRHDAQPTGFEREVLAIFLEEPALLGLYQERIPPHRFGSDLYRSIYERMLARRETLLSPTDIFSLFAEDHTSVELLSSLQRPDRSSTVRYAGTDERRAHLERVVARLQLDDQKARYKELSQRIDELLGAGKPVSEDLRTEYEALVHRLKR